MQQIVVLLQLVLVLLSNPATANDPNVQTLASQAITVATQALAQQQQTQTYVFAGLTKAPLGMEYDGNGNLIVMGSEQEQGITKSQGIGAPDLGSVVVPSTTPQTPTSSFCIPLGAYPANMNNPNDPCGTNDRICEARGDCGQPWLSCNTQHQCFCQNPRDNRSC